METKKEEKSPVIRYWPQLLILCIVCIGIGESINKDEGFINKIFGIEKEHEHDVEYLNGEDDGVRADFERADDCNAEIARLQNEVLYWKLKYEYVQN